jgi:hypothetical protein
MNFFGIEISDAQFEAAMKVARDGWRALEDYADGFVVEREIAEAIGFEAGDVVAPPAGVINRES